jgi:hypothetical protein
VISRRAVRAAAVLSLLVLLGASPAPLPSPSPSPPSLILAGPPATAHEFLTRFRDAINAKDKPSVDALVYWGTADDWSRGMTESLLAIFEAETIASDRLAPLDASSKATIPMNGHVYGPSIAPVYRVIVEYAHGPDVTQDEGSFTIGKANGGWYIIAIAREP